MTRPRNRRLGYRRLGYRRLGYRRLGYRRVVWVIGALLGLGVAGYLLSRRSVESELLGRLERVGSAVRQDEGSTSEMRRAKLEGSLGAVLAHDVTVTLPELSLREQGRAALTEALSEALGRYQKIELLIGRVSSRVNPAQHRAVTDVEATFQAESAQGLLVDRRNAVVNWTEQNGEWRVVRILVGERDRALPEARP